MGFPKRPGYGLVVFPGGFAGGVVHAAGAAATAAATLAGSHSGSASRLTPKPAACLSATRRWQLLPDAAAAAAAPATTYIRRRVAGRGGKGGDSAPVTGPVWPCRSAEREPGLRRGRHCKTVRQRAQTGARAGTRPHRAPRASSTPTLRAAPPCTHPAVASATVQLNGLGSCSQKRGASAGSATPAARPGGGRRSLRPWGCRARARTWPSTGCACRASRCACRRSCSWRCSRRRCRVCGHNHDDRSSARPAR